MATHHEALNLRLLTDAVQKAVNVYHFNASQDFFALESLSLQMYV